MNRSVALKCSCLIVGLALTLAKPRIPRALEDTYKELIFQKSDDKNQQPCMREDLSTKNSPLVNLLERLLEQSESIPATTDKFLQTVIGVVIFIFEREPLVENRQEQRSVSFGQGYDQNPKFPCSKERAEQIHMDDSSFLDSLWPNLKSAFSTSCDDEDCTYSGEQEDSIGSTFANFGSMAATTITKYLTDLGQLLGYTEPDANQFVDIWIGYRPILSDGADPFQLTPLWRWLLRLFVLVCFYIILQTAYSFLKLDLGAKKARRLSRLSVTASIGKNNSCLSAEEDRETKGSEKDTRRDNLKGLSVQPSEAEQVVNVWTADGFPYFDNSAEYQESIEELYQQLSRIPDRQSDEKDGIKEDDSMAKEDDISAEEEYLSMEEVPISPDADSLIEDALADQHSSVLDEHDAKADDLHLQLGHHSDTEQSFPSYPSTPREGFPDDADSADEPSEINDSSFLGSPGTWWHDVSTNILDVSTGFADTSMSDILEKVTQSDILNGSAEGFVLATAALTGRVFTKSPTAAEK